MLRSAASASRSMTKSSETALRASSDEVIPFYATSDSFGTLASTERLRPLAFAA